MKKQTYMVLHEHEHGTLTYCVKTNKDLLMISDTELARLLNLTDFDSNTEQFFVYEINELVDLETKQRIGI